MNAFSMLNYHQLSQRPQDKLGIFSIVVKKYSKYFKVNEVLIGLTSLVEDFLFIAGHFLNSLFNLNSFIMNGSNNLLGIVH